MHNPDDLIRSLQAREGGASRDFIGWGDLSVNLGQMYNLHNPFESLEP